MENIGGKDSVSFQNGVWPLTLIICRNHEILGMNVMDVCDSTLFSSSFSAFLGRLQRRKMSLPNPVLDVEISQEVCALVSFFFRLLRDSLSGQSVSSHCGIR